MKMMSSCSTTSTSLLLLVCLLSSSHAFLMTPLKSSLSAPRLPLQMADEPLSQDRIGDTERLLLERKRIQDLGLIQELGRTVRKDGLDGLRAFLWVLYHASNVVFPVLAVGMFAGICLNLTGYGYYWDQDSHRLMIDTLQHIRQENIYQQELLKLAESHASKAATFWQQQ